MNEINQSILKTIDLVVKDNLNKIHFDQSIKGTIDSVVNINTGEYKIKYEDGIFSAFSENTSIIYKEGDQVWIKIPEGDYSNKKLIESKISSLDSANNDSNNRNNIFVNILEPSWDEFYNYNKSQQFGLIAGVSSPLRIWKHTNESDTIFSNYNNLYGKIQLKASFQTNLMSDYNSGNYGLKIGFRVRKYDENGEEVINIIYYNLDLSSFIGSPYKLNTFTPQSVQIDVGTNFLIGLESIEFFQENLHTDYRYSYNEDGSSEKIFNETIPNIFVKDIELNFIELVDYSQEPFYINIQTPQGNSFVGIDKNSLDLKGSLLHYGKEILPSDICECYWFKENFSITFDNEKYDNIGGTGWEKIDGNYNILTLTREANILDQKYKLVIIYDKELTFTKEIVVYYNSGNIIISQELINSDIQLSIVDLVEKKQYNGKWYKRTSDNSYEILNGGNLSNNIIINQYLIYSYNIFYCEIFDETNSLIANRQILIEKSVSENDITVSYKGRSVFNYDANGNITISNPELRQQLYATVTLKEGYATSFKISWYLGDVVIGKEDIHPENSMIDSIRVDSSNTLQYLVKTKYKQNNTNNTLSLKISTIDGKEFVFTKELIFQKDGDQGTNGTSYSCIVAPCNNDGTQRLTGFQSLHYNRIYSSSTKPLYLKAYVYKDGELVSNNISYKWESRSECLTFTTINSDKSAIQVNGNSTINSDLNINREYEYIIKATITISDKDRHITLYYNYPVNITVGDIIDNQQLNIVIPQQIQYSSSGINPQFSNDELCFNYLNEDRLNSNFVSSLKSNLIDIDFNKKQLNPVAFFDYSTGSGLLKLYYTSTSYILYTIIMYLNTYGNQAINGWDGTNLKLDESSGTILAPQVGAGIKDNNGLFTGIILGQDTAQNKIGLYGYKAGVSSFGFLDDGTAYIGLPTGGRLKFNGKKSTIESSSYSSGTGLCIDFDDGSIISKQNNKIIFRVQQKQKSPYLVIQNTSEKTLMNIADNDYYLQSANAANLNTNNDKSKIATGMKIDFDAGNIYASKGIFYGDISIKKADGSEFTYTGYTYETSTGDVEEMPEKQTWVKTITLSDVLGDLKSNASRIEALTEKATAIAEDAAWAVREAQSTADYAADLSNDLKNKLDASSSGYGYINYWGGSGTTVNGNGIYITATEGGYGRGQVRATENGCSLNILGYSGESVSHYFVVKASGISSDLPGLSDLSDMRLKDNITYLTQDSIINFYKDLKVASYYMNNKEDKKLLNFGLIAQDVQKSFKNFFPNENTDIVTYRYEDILGIYYNNINALSILIIQNLLKDVEQLKQEIKELKEINDINK